MERAVLTKIVQIPTGRIADWDSFHDVFAKALGFPDFYGRNMNAWIDCLTSADDAEAGMVGVSIASGELLALSIVDAADFSERCPEQYDALIECASFVNYRRIQMGEDPVLALLLEGHFRNK